jgi:hypothetical protein
VWILQDFWDLFLGHSVYPETVHLTKVEWPSVSAAREVEWVEWVEV